MLRTAPRAQSVPAASNVMLPRPLFGRFQMLPIKHSAGASSKIVLTEYAGGKFSLSIECNTHCPFTPLRHAAADGEPLAGPRWDEHDTNKKKPNRMAVSENNDLFIILKKDCMIYDLYFCDVKIIDFV